MGVVKEYVCLAHGSFTADEARCPAGCTTSVEREFRTAPAIGTAKTKATDAALARLAAQYGYTDMSNRAGSVAASQRRGKTDPDYRPRWERIPKGDLFHAGGQIEAREGSEGGANVPTGQYHTGEAIGPRLGVSAELLATNAVPLPLGKLPPRPRPNVVMKDNTSAADFKHAVESAT